MTFNYLDGDGEIQAIDIYCEKCGFGKFKERTDFKVGMIRNDYECVKCGQKHSFPRHWIVQSLGFSIE